MSPHHDRTHHVEWGRGHGLISGPANAAYGTFALALLGHAAQHGPHPTHISPLLPLGLGAAAALGCLGAGAWDAWALATTPVAANQIATLAGGVVLAALLAPALARRARPEPHPSAATHNPAGDSVRALTPPPESAHQRGELAAEWESRLARVCGVRDARVLGIQTWEHKTGYTIDVQLPPGGHTWQNLKTHTDGLASDASLPPGCGVEVLHGCGSPPQTPCSTSSPTRRTTPPPASASRFRSGCTATPPPPR